MVHVRRWVLMVAGVLGVSVAAGAITGNEVLAKIRGTYDKVNSFQAAFEQTFEWKLAGTTQTMRGTFSMKKPNKFRIQTNVQTVVSNGRVVWSYSPATGQVIITNYDPTTMPLRPDNFLFVFPDERRTTYVRSERLSGEDHHVVDVTPRDSTLGISKMRVWVDGRSWLAKKVQYTSVSGDVTTYLMNAIQTNTSIPDSVFTFTPPPGVDVIDFRNR
ncbi:MAG: Outer-membrane lipoprotein carrier protein precursor [Candidatus Latescibacteria bacterium ADurb.Bin168]|nr:MAG: Outer-membrane lipoprotein carrier protein precursor [Candidatus Latescibacteria bacterium ADurb.Bin168]